MHTHFVVREDVQQLYGFATQSERQLFRYLIKVNGVGPKMALAILSGMSANDFAICVHNNDIATLVKLPGVGKKTAERLIIEMRDRIDASVVGGGKAAPLTVAASARNEAVDALVALGYKPKEVNSLIANLDVVAKFNTVLQ